MTALNGVSAPYRIVPVENRRGPSFTPDRISSALVKTVSQSFEGSCEVVTPKARLRHQRPARLRENPVVFPADMRVNVDDARHDRLAGDVDAASHWQAQ